MTFKLSGGCCKTRKRRPGSNGSVHPHNRVSFIVNFRTQSLTQVCFNDECRRHRRGQCEMWDFNDDMRLRERAMRLMML